VKLYFLRHGVAPDPQTWEGDDFVRPLTADGRKRMKREAKALAKLDLTLDLILTSPLVRAQQTAAIVAQRLNLQHRLVEDERLGPGFGAERLGAILREHSDAGALMLVGHEPSMSATIGEIVGGARIELKKGGLACVEVDSAASSCTLAWLVSPKVLLGGPG